MPILENAPLWLTIELKYCHEVNSYISSLAISLHAKLTSYLPHSHENGVDLLISAGEVKNAELLKCQYSRFFVSSARSPDSPIPLTNGMGVLISVSKPGGYAKTLG